MFDLDGVVVDSEQVWDEVREELVRERGGRWSESAQADMMGMSSPEWSRYLHEELRLPEPPEELNDEEKAFLAHDLPRGSNAARQDRGRK